MNTSGCHFNITHSYNNCWNTEIHLTELITLEKVIFYSMNWEFKWTNTYENFCVHFFYITNTYKNFWNTEIRSTELITLEAVMFYWFQWELKSTNIYENIWMPLSHNPYL